MWHAADLREKLHQATNYGYKGVEDDHVDWPALKAKRDAYIVRLNGIYERSTSFVLHSNGAGLMAC